LSNDLLIEPSLNEWLIETSAPAIDQPAVDLEPWRILIVDDNVDVHVVTKFSLRNVTFLGRQLTFFHAYSGKEGLSVLRETPDIALVLLDVVMENDHAGLTLARQIRAELGNHLVRIVLRTGQSGQAMEQNVIVEYDINDYRTKSDLTTQKLFTTVISSLRSYDGMLTTVRSKEALKISLNKIKGLQSALDQHAIVDITDTEGKFIYVNEHFCTISQYSREELIGNDYRQINSGLHSAEFMQAIWDTLLKGEFWQGEIRNKAKDGSYYWLDTTMVPFFNTAGKPYQFAAIRTNITERKRHEASLLSSEAQLRSVFDFNPTAICVFSIGLNQVYFSNPAMSQLFAGFDDIENYIATLRFYLKSLKTCNKVSSLVSN